MRLDVILRIATKIFLPFIFMSIYQLIKFSLPDKVGYPQFYTQLLFEKKIINIFLKNYLK